MSTHDEDFWGNQSEWPTQSVPKVTRRADVDRSGPIDIVRRGWNQVLSSGAHATREHGIVRPGMARPDDRTPVAPVRHDLFDDLDDDLGWDVAPRRTHLRPADPVTAPAVHTAHADPVDVVDVDDDDVLVIDGWGAEFVPVDERRRRPAAAFVGASAARRSHGGGHVGQVGIDPLIARIGALAVVTVLLIPVVLGFLSGGDDTDLLETATLAAAPSTTTVPLIVVPPAASPATAAAPAPSASATTPITAAPVTQPQASTASAPDSSGAPAEPSTSTGVSASSPSLSSTGANAPAEADEPASRVERPCPIEYEVVAGDFWIRLADGAGVPLADLLGANGATVNTPLFPGATICLPAGSSVPPPPATTPPTTQAPTTTAPPTTAPPTTAPPTTRPPTTQPPTTTAPPTTRVPTTGEVQQIIRNVWPDELEDRAIEIAFRESRFVPTAKNFCCYGIFQIYWTVHRGWLDDIGITSDQQLFDPETNARAAYALYQRAGGWGPWGF